MKQNVDYGSSQSITMHFEQFKKLQDEIEHLNKKYVIKQLNKGSIIKVECVVLKSGLKIIWVNRIVNINIFLLRCRIMRILKRYIRCSLYLPV